MNLRIAYYVVAFAISLAAFTGANGYAADASDAAARANADAADANRAEARARENPALKVADMSAVSPASVAAIARAVAASNALARADADAADANAHATRVARTAYGTAVAVSLAAFTGAFILGKRRAA